MWRLWCVLLVTGNVMAAEAYKCKGKNGELIFADQPCAKNAELIELKEPQTFSAPASQPNAPMGEPVETSKPPAKVNYREFRVESPRAGEVFDDGSGNVMVSLYMEPMLSEGHKIQLYLNGQAYGEATNQFVWALQNLDRGEYQIKAELRDQRGRVLKSTQSSFVVIKRVAKNMVTSPGVPPKVERESDGRRR